MKRMAVWIVALGTLSLVLALGCEAKERKPKANKQPPAPVVQEPPAAPPVFSFTAEEEMQQFAKLWQQRQAAITRMSVLQAYWNDEQRGVEKVTQELATKYNLDPAKTYTLDIPRKALVEVPTPPTPAPNAQPDSAVPPAASTASPAAVPSGP